jgi:ABC-type cobalamin/Fe3+-siderophores transport system ATPase subunit
LNEKIEIPKLAIVGPCGAGKSTLVEGLRVLGLDAKEIAQEHSYVPTMWKKITPPDILIFLDVSFKFSTRRKNFQWSIRDYSEQIQRLHHARENCDIYIQTDDLTPEEVLKAVLDMLDVGHLLISDV